MTCPLRQRSLLVLSGAHLHLSRLHGRKAYQRIAAAPGDVCTRVPIRPLSESGHAHPVRRSVLEGAFSGTNRVQQRLVLVWRQL